MVQQQTKNSRKRKALLVLPLLTIPFLTLAFWALGGGKGALGKKETGGGLNMHLPDPQLKASKGQDKLSFYTEAEKRADKGSESLGLDRYLPMEVAHLRANRQSPFDPAPYTHPDGADASEEKVYRKLELLQRRLQAPPTRTTESDWSSLEPPPLTPAVPPLRAVQAAEDPQLAQLNAMMDKILDIQHPERLKNKRQEIVDRDSGGVLPVPSIAENHTVTLMEEDTGRLIADRDGFYGMSSMDLQEPASNVIRARVHQNQKVTTGSSIQLRLLDELSIGNMVVPGGSFVTGIVKMYPERVQVRISSIRHQDILLPVNLEVFDLDGLPGIAVRGASSNSMAGSVAGPNMRALDILGADPALKSQAATLGVQTVKSLLSKNARQVKVTLRAGHQVFLKEGGNE